MTPNRWRLYRSPLQILLGSLRLAYSLTRLFGTICRPRKQLHDPPLALILVANHCLIGQLRHVDPAMHINWLLIARGISNCRDGRRQSVTGGQHREICGEVVSGVGQGRFTFYQLSFPTPFTPFSIFTSRCTVVQSTVLRCMPPVCPSVTLVDQAHIGWN